MKSFIKSVNSGFFDIYDNGKTIRLKSKGLLRNLKVQPLAGDIVEYENGLITKVLPRTNRLIRPPIANLDQALLVVSLAEPEISLATISQYVFAIEMAGIKPIIVFSKSDLISNTNLADFFQKLNYQVIIFSSLDKTGVDLVLALLKGKKTALIGQSGVGKSSLINALDPQINLKTAEISLKLGRGKHTTRVIEFIELAGGFIADTPGFSLFDFSKISANELAQFYPGFAQISQCRFRVCLHKFEPDCKIKEQAESDQLMMEHYQNYLKLLEQIQRRKKYG